MHNFMILCAASMLGAAVLPSTEASARGGHHGGHHWVIIADTTGSIAAAGIITEVSPRCSF